MNEINTVFSLDSKIISTIEEMVNNEKYEESLDIVYKLMMHLVSNNNLKNVFNHVPQLDSILQKIGNKILNKNIFNNNYECSGDVNLILASEIYTTGGHTRLIEDFTKATNSKKIIVLTDIFERYSSGKLVVGELFEKIKSPIVILPKGDKVSKIKNLQMIFSTLNVRTINIIAHHQDVVSYAACVNEINIPQYFYHHADHNPTLGATISHYQHYDLFLSSRFLCEKTRYVKPLYMPLSSPCRFIRDLSFEVINTVTSGTMNKFTFDDVDVNYSNLVLTILSNINGCHFHIGPLTEEAISIVRNNLENNNINKDRFVCLGVVPNIQDAIIENNINVYITSAPIGGGKAFIDVLGVGICIFLYKDPQLKFSKEINPIISDEYNYSSDIIRWSTRGELLEKLKSTKFKLYSEIIKSFYSKYHSEDKFLTLCQNIFEN